MNIKEARSQAESTKPGLQHKFGNLTLFSPQICPDSSNGPGHSISYNTTCLHSNDSDQPAQMCRLIRVGAVHRLAKHLSFL